MGIAWFFWTFVESSFIAVVLLLIYGGITTYLRYQRHKAELAHLPGINQCVEYRAAINYLIPRSWAPYHRNNIFHELPGIFAKCKSPIVKFASSKSKVVFINDRLLTKEMCVSRRREFLKPSKEMYGYIQFYGESVLASHGETWKKHRDVATPAFTKENLIMVSELAQKKVAEMFAKWEQHRARGDKTVHLQEDMTNFTLAIIAGAGFGQHLDTFKQSKNSDAFDTKSHQCSFQEAMEITLGINHIVVKYLFPDWMMKWLPIKHFNRTKMGFDEFGSYSQDIISTRQKEIDGGTVEINNVTGRKDDLLTLLLTSEKKMEGNINPITGKKHIRLTNGEVKSNFYTFFFAGHETTAGMLSWCMLLASIHPDVQEKMHQEVEEVLQGRVPKFEDQKNLKYIMSCINETLRLYPAVVNIPKKTYKETTLGPYKIPADTTINVSSWSIHRNPEYWDEPEAFKPERFMKGYHQKVPGIAHVPFSVGGRKCIGNKFAEAEAITILAMMVQKYTFTIPEGKDTVKMLETDIQLTCIPKNLVELVATPRDKAQRRQQ